MTKRFTSTEKWDDPWYRKLSLKAKCFWDYICCHADNAGLWKIDWDLVSFKIGESVDLSVLDEINRGKERIKIHDDEYLMIFGFIPYQIGVLNSDKLTNLQKNCKSLLEKHITEKKIDGSYVLGTSSVPVPMRYKYKDKGKGKSLRVANINTNIYISMPPNKNELWDFCQNNGVDPETFYNYYQAKGWMLGRNKMKDWKAAVISWKLRSKEQDTNGRTAPL